MIGGYESPPFFWCPRQGPLLKFIATSLRGPFECECTMVEVLERNPGMSLQARCRACYRALLPQSSPCQDSCQSQLLPACGPRLEVSHKKLPKHKLRTHLSPELSHLSRLLGRVGTGGKKPRPGVDAACVGQNKATCKDIGRHGAWSNNS